MVSSERSISDLSEYIPFQIRKYYFFLRKSTFRLGIKMFRFQSSVILWISVIASVRTDSNLSDCNQFLFKNRFKFNKYIFFIVKKWEIQAIIFLITLTRYTERIFNAMRYTGNILTEYNFKSRNSAGRGSTGLICLHVRVFYCCILLIWSLR